MLAPQTTLRRRGRRVVQDHWRSGASLKRLQRARSWSTFLPTPRATLAFLPALLSSWWASQRGQPGVRRAGHPPAVPGRHWLSVHLGSGSLGQCGAVTGAPLFTLTVLSKLLPSSLHTTGAGRHAAATRRPGGGGDPARTRGESAQARENLYRSLIWG